MKRKSQKKKLAIKRNTISRTGPKPSGTTHKKNKLYEALLHILQLLSIGRFLFLKSDHFLKLCEIDFLDWNLSKSWLKKDFLKTSLKKAGLFNFHAP